MRNPLSMDVRMPDAGVIVSTGEMRSGERGVRWLLVVCEVARASFDDDCFVCIRNVGCGVIGLAEFNDGVRFERLEADRMLCRT